MKSAKDKYIDETKILINKFSKFCHMTLKRLFVFTFILLSTQVKVYSTETYMFGGAKIFNYGIDKSDLQVINTSLVALGFS